MAHRIAVVGYDCILVDTLTDSWSCMVAFALVPARVVHSVVAWCRVDTMSRGRKTGQQVQGYHS